MAESRFKIAVNSRDSSVPGQRAQSGEMTFAAALSDSIISNIFVTLPTLSLSSMPKCWRQVPQERISTPFSSSMEIASVASSSIVVNFTPELMKTMRQGLGDTSIHVRRNPRISFWPSSSSPLPMQLLPT